MASLGPLSPTTAANVAGEDVAWSNPTNVLLDDSAVAAAVLTGSLFSQEIQVGGFSFSSLPPSYDVNGISFGIDWRVSGGGSANATVRLIGAGGVTIGSAKSVAVPTFFQVTTLGGAADLWGATSAAIVNAIAAGTLKVGIVLHGSGTATGQIDFASLTVNYTERTLVVGTSHSSSKHLVLGL